MRELIRKVPAQVALKKWQVGGGFLLALVLLRREPIDKAALKKNLLLLLFSTG